MSWYTKTVIAASGGPKAIIDRTPQGIPGVPANVPAMFIINSFNIKDALKNNFKFKWDFVTKKGWFITMDQFNANKQRLAPALQGLGVDLNAVGVPDILPGMQDNPQAQNRPTPQPVIQQPQQIQQPLVSPTWILAKVKALGDISVGAPVVISQTPSKSWQWLSRDGERGEILPNENIASMVESVRDANNKPYTAKDPEELFRLVEDAISSQSDSTDEQKESQEPIVPIDPAAREKGMIPADRISPEQKQIETKFAEGKENIMINALAGTGKTTVLKHLAWSFGKQDQKWLYLVFNTKNALEGRAKFPPFVKVMTTNAYFGQLLGDDKNRGRIKKTERISSLSGGKKESKRDRVRIPKKVELLCDGREFKQKMQDIGLRDFDANMQKEIVDSYDKFMVNVLSSLIKKIRVDFRMSVVKLTELCKSFAVNPQDTASLDKSIFAIIEKYKESIDLNLNGVKERIMDYNDNPGVNRETGKRTAGFRTRIIRALEQILGFDIINRDFTKEIIDGVKWLLSSSLPGATNEIFTHPKTLKQYNLGDFRDFSDDLWYPAIFAKKLYWEPWHVVLADEVQDFNECQKQALSNLKDQKARVVAVGDPNQALYRFRGADSDAFENLQKMLGASASNSLSYNFRSRKKIVDYSNTHTSVTNLQFGKKISEKDLSHFLEHANDNEKGPEYLAAVKSNFTDPQTGQIDMKAWAKAINSNQIPWPPTEEGEVTEGTIKYQDMFDNLDAEKKKTGKIKPTAILCRTNAPLIFTALNLLSKGILFAIAGKDIAGDLLKHLGFIMKAKVDRYGELSKDDSLTLFLNKMQRHLEDFTMKNEHKAARQSEIKDLKMITEAVQGCIASFDSSMKDPKNVPSPSTGNVNVEEYEDDDPNFAGNRKAFDPMKNQSSATIEMFEKYLVAQLGGYNLESSGEEAEKEIKEWIERVEESDNPPVVLSTSHLSKGLEFSRVFVLRNDQFPHPSAKGKEDLRQEANAKYVTYTRAQDELHILALDGQPGYEKQSKG